MQTAGAFMGIKGSTGQNVAMFFFFIFIQNIWNLKTCLLIYSCLKRERLMLAHHYVLLESFINCSFYFLLYFKLLRYKKYMWKKQQQKKNFCDCASLFIYWIDTIPINTIFNVS